MMLRKTVTSIVVATIALLSIYGVLSFLIKPVPDHPYFNPDDFLVIAHRGGRGLGPEGTTHTFERAVALGVDVLELDLHSTRDGELVILHDQAVDRTTDGTGPIDEYDLDDLKRLDAAYRWTPDHGRSFPLRDQGITVPTLAEVFEGFPDTRVNIEIKGTHTNTVHSICRSIRTHRMSEKVMVASFDADALEEFRSACPEVATSAGASEAMLFYWLQKVRMESIYSSDARALQLPFRYGDIQVVTPRLSDAAHARNLRVHVWTVNDAETMKQLLDMGVDGIMTDYPDRLLRVLEDREASGHHGSDDLR
jgi:glycerophosphoryl diester phosphodiesterase